MLPILKNITTPTGNILIVEGEHGPLECLCLGDYGKDINIKCDAMGLTRKPEPVKHTKLLPLEEKIVITISSQYSCLMGCKFCDAPKVKLNTNILNATTSDLKEQVETCLSLHPELKFSKRLNIHYARIGEPTFNDSVLQSANLLYHLYRNKFHIHPVVSTMMPKNNKNLELFLYKWMHLKNNILNGEAGLQLSINSTDENERQFIFNKQSYDLSTIAHIVNNLHKPLGRKITLNFAIANWTIDAEYLYSLFSPENYICKLTPIHNTAQAGINNIKTLGDFTTYIPYQEYEEKLKRVGFDVLVFLPSKEEDESMITCGNAILAK